MIAMRNKTQDTERAVFTKAMRKEYTILVPTMLPVHFKFFQEIFRQHGYKVDILDTSGPTVVEEGLKNVHNDTCYPALVVIGQLMEAVKSGRYDPHKIALLLSQTGGGCRASNYIHLLRKALKKSGYGYIPVISLNMGGLEKNPGFQLNLTIAMKLIYAVILGDLFMLLANQCRPYEINPGDTDRVVDEQVKKCMDALLDKKIFHVRSIKFEYQSILDAFAAIPRRQEEKPRVGIVGEIYVKFSPLGNNHLEDFLLSEGCEVVMPGLLDFCMYCLYNGIIDHKLYGSRLAHLVASRFGFDFLLKKQKAMISVIEKHGVFRAPTAFDHTKDLADGYINHGVKMGEGWLLTAEMLELIEQGVNNIVCTQPFGCLPNHIVAKGMMHAIKEKHPQANIVAVDYDPGASEVNQQNRIKLMLANARVAMTVGGEK
jgi:predicted nucleotide-binding protein (sugar kinase/HSP70/actin superfamily)